MGLGFLTEEEKEQMQIGDRERIDELYRYLRGISTKFTLSEEDREDIIQETAIKTLTKLHQYDPEKAKASTWIYTIFINLLKGHKRKEKRAVVGGVSYDAESERGIFRDLLEDQNTQNPLERMVRLEEIENAEAILRDGLELRERGYSELNLSCRGLGLKEIGVSEGISKGTAQSRKYKAITGKD